MPRKDYYWKNREKCLVASAEHQRGNPELTRAKKARYRAKPEKRALEFKYKKEYKANHKKEVSEYNKAYYKKNKHELIAKKVAYSRARRGHDVKFRLNDNVRSFIRISLRKNKNGYKWEGVVGYTLQDLYKHLERQFDEGMSWGNYGTYWWIDHIRPVSSFDYTSPQDKEFKDCWALENLRPMEKIANIKKGNKYIFV